MICCVKFLALIAAVCAFLVLAGCGGGGSTRSAVLIGEEGRPDVPVPEGSPPKKVVVEDLEGGAGPPAEKGDLLTIRYFNFDYESHQVYEDRWSDEDAFSFTLGADEVLGTWEAGLRGMKVGGRRELIVPKEMAYGNVDQVYVVELLSVESPEAGVREVGGLRKVVGTGAKPRLEIPPGPPPDELVVRELKPGVGKSVESGERLGVRYVAKRYGSDVVEDRWEEQPPYSFVLGEGDVREGWEIGLKGVKLGARRELILPSRLAYGTGAMVYVVEAIEAEKQRPARRG
jgi:peptidylprolyl isomerase